MALIQCAECSKEVSTEAGACPHCGAKRKKGGFVGKIFLGVIGAVVVVFVLALIAAPSDEKRQADYMKAREECARAGAQLAIPAGSTTFTRANEAAGYAYAMECLRKKGFKPAES